MFSLLIVYLAMLFIIELVLGSSTSVHNQELGQDPRCEPMIRLTGGKFCTQLIPFLLGLAALLVLSSRC